MLAPLHAFLGWSDEYDVAQYYLVEVVAYVPHFVEHEKFVLVEYVVHELVAYAPVLLLVPECYDAVQQL
jgi:hypothetical protein